MKAYLDASSCNLWFKSISVIYSDKFYVSSFVSFCVGVCFNGASISDSICFLVGLFLAMPCETASDEKE